MACLDLLDAVHDCVTSSRSAARRGGRIVRNKVRLHRRTGACERQESASQVPPEAEEPEHFDGRSTPETRLRRGLKGCAFDGVTTALWAWTRLRGCERYGDGLDRWTSIAQAKEGVRADRICIRPLHRLGGVLPSVDGCAHNPQPPSEFFLRVTDQLAQVAYLGWIEFLQLQDVDRKQEGYLIQDAAVHVDAAALRANKRRHVVYNNSLHVEEHTNIVINELLNKAPSTAYGAADLSGFCWHDRPLTIHDRDEDDLRSE